MSEPKVPEKAEIITPAEVEGSVHLQNRLAAGFIDLVTQMDQATCRDWLQSGGWVRGGDELEWRWHIVNPIEEQA